MSKTLLVVDDATILRLQIKDAAGSAGWDVVGEASNGREAVERYAKHRPTAVTLDLVMPDYDGLYALRNIMAIDPDAKVVIVSALGQKSVLRDAFKLGASDFIVKPFDADALVQTLSQFASSRPTVNAAV
jgi:two-component system chemotaxis response regulator CheY